MIPDKKMRVLGFLLTICTIPSGLNAQDPMPTDDVPQEAAAPEADVASEAPIADSGAPALTPTAMEEPAAPLCELHVFPSPEGEAQTTGWLSGFGIIGAVADAAANDGKNKSESDYLRDALGPEMQVLAMKSMDLVTELKLPPSQIVYEQPLQDRKVYTSAKSRLSNSSAACYFELVITQNFYQKAAIYGRSLNNRFIFKDFSNGATEAKLIKGRGGNGLKDFPPKTPEESEAAETDLRRAFVANFQEFAKTR